MGAVLFGQPSLAVFWCKKETGIKQGKIIS